MSLNNGERQVSPTRDGIRRDHVARYEFAARIIGMDKQIADFACGVGYGTNLLAWSGCRVFGFDVSDDALAYAREHYAHKKATFLKMDGNAPEPLGDFDAAVCFETIEHIEDPLPLLQALNQASPMLIASVPNEDVMPYGKGYAFHFRHYTKQEFEELLAAAGWKVIEWWGQAGPTSEVERDMNGRTLIAICERGVTPANRGLPPPPRPAPPMPTVKPAKQQAPKHVSIVGLGPSSAQYVSICRGLGGRHKYCDETWVINAFGDVLAHDRVFHMDDVRIQQIRADAAPESNIAAMLEWLKSHPGPIITSRAHSEYPGLVEFPLAEVVNEFPTGYFNSTAAYAVAYAVYLGVERISVFGCDFTYPNAHDAEKGRACVEYWLGIAASRGIQLIVPKQTTLLDAINTQAERFYGYDCVDLGIKRVDGRVVIDFKERESLPTAEEIEHAYCHSRHPNQLVENENAN